MGRGCFAGDRLADTGRSLGGLALVVIGIALIATRGDLVAFRRPGGQAGVRWGTATGGLIASYTVVDAYAVKALGIAPVILDWFSNLLRFFVSTPVVGANPRRAMIAMKGHWWLAVGVGLLSPLSYIFILAALQNGAPLSLVAPVREMSMLVGSHVEKGERGFARLEEEALIPLRYVMVSARQ